MVTDTFFFWGGETRIHRGDKFLVPVYNLKLDEVDPGWMSYLCSSMKAVQSMSVPLRGRLNRGLRCGTLFSLLGA